MYIAIISYISHPDLYIITDTKLKNFEKWQKLSYIFLKHKHHILLKSHEIWAVLHKHV